MGLRRQARPPARFDQSPLEIRLRSSDLTRQRYADPRELVNKVNQILPNGWVLPHLMAAIAFYESIDATPDPVVVHMRAVQGQLCLVCIQVLPRAHLPIDSCKSRSQQC
jgi:hypothetical protein